MFLGLLVGGMYSELLLAVGLFNYIFSLFLYSCTDPSITIRRKVSFFINLLLMPTTDKRPLDIQVGPALHTPAALDTSTSPSLPSPSASSPAPIVHPNSHASMISDPSSANTSPIALKAMREHKLLDSVVTALVDAQYEVDNQVQENCVKCVFIPASATSIVDIFISCRILYTFAVVCDAPFTQEEKLILRKFWDEQNNQVGNEKALAERWDFQVDELLALKTKLMTG
jgi:hsp70-interacting protein